MAHSFLNKPFALKALFALLCMVLFVHAQGEETISDAPHLPLLSIDECEAMLSNYYKNDTIDAELLFGQLERAEAELSSELNSETHAATRNRERENELLTHYLKYAKALSTAYVFGAINKYGERIRKMDAQVQAFMQKAQPNAATARKRLYSMRKRSRKRRTKIYTSF